MSERFAVVTDSTADIEASMAEANGIDVVPLLVTIGSESFRDGDLTQEEFFARMARAPHLPTTSQPSVGQFVEAYERALQRADQVLSIHISEKLSGTVQSARQAAERFAGKVHVFDSLNLSWGLALQVMEAANAAREGFDVSSTVKQLEGARERVRLIVGLDSLDNLAKGGRIGRVSALLGAMLNLKVTLTVAADGAFQPVARTRGESAALEHTLRWCEQQLAPSRKAKFAVGHAASKARAERLADEIRSRFDAVDVVLYEAGSVICTHTGPGWGVALLPVE